MRHRTKKTALGIDKDHTTSMVKNLVTSLILHERVKTTKQRARALQSNAERAITIAKRMPKLQAIRHLGRYVSTEKASKKLLGELRDRFSKMESGYTRTIKVGRRGGDDAELIMVEFVQVDADPSAEPRSGEAPSEKGDKSPTIKKAKA